MKRLWLITGVLMFAVLACSLPGTVAENAAQEPQPQEQVQPQGRCGDQICDGPENPQNCPEDCPAAQAKATDDAPLPPPWFAPDENCDQRETSVRSEGSPWAFDSQGNTTELLDGQITCVLEIQVCGDTIFKQQVINTDESCPESLHYSYAPPTSVCCDKWDQAKETHSPCNPLEDADCDGVLNNADAYPLEFTQQ